jgi:hypothetical protein
LFLLHLKILHLANPADPIKHIDYLSPVKFPELAQIIYEGLNKLADVRTRYRKMFRSTDLAELCLVQGNLTGSLRYTT